MNEVWKGKRVLITGGTSGLGRELALLLRDFGANVAIVARGFANLPGVVGIQADIADKNDTYRISAEAIGQLGGLDVLINNASYLGMTPLRDLLDTECEDFERVLTTNVLGPFRLTKAVLPAILKSPGGIVLNISSDAAINAYPKWGPYSASKAALMHLSRIWGEELKEAGVRFLAIDPGDMDTPMHAAAIPDADPAALTHPRVAAHRLLHILSGKEGGL